ncbi:MAG: helix-turn-helix transcriptional regulator [Thermoanaerobaculia bacterium]|nr:helix-turn-helix transcriptional regulator [Thermoanaerobaculia bacterium]
MRLDEALALRDAAAQPVLEQIRADREQSDHRIRQFLDRLEIDLYSNDFTVSRLIRKLKIKGTGSLERFTALTGLAPAAYVEEARHETAARLLIESELTIETIAELVGFAAAAGFGRAFRRWSGMSPSELRKRALEAKNRGAPIPDLAFARRRWLRKIEEQTLEPAEIQKVLAAEAAARGGEVAAATKQRGWKRSKPPLRPLGGHVRASCQSPSSSAPCATVVIARHPRFSSTCGKRAGKKGELTVAGGSRSRSWRWRASAR